MENSEDFETVSDPSLNRIKWSNAPPLMKVSLLGIGLGLGGLLLHSLMTPSISLEVLPLAGLTISAYFVFGYYRNRLQGMGSLVSIIESLTMTVIINSLVLIAFYPPPQLDERVVTGIVLLCVLAITFTGFEESLREYLKKYDSENQPNEPMN